jgi:hypothetical protein
MGAKRAVRLTGLLVVMLLGMEVAARIWVSVRSPEASIKPWGHAHWARSATNYAADPFTAFSLNPGFSEHSEQGFRESKIYANPHEGARIVVLGGSNVYGTQVHAEDTFPRLLEQRLHDLDRDDVQVVNAGVPAFTTANLIGHLALRVLDLEPDICLLDVGYTDAVARIRYAGFRADYTHDYRSWCERARPLWRHSRLLNGIANRLGFRFAEDPSIHDLAQWPSDPDFASNFASSSVEPFRRNLRSLIGICRAHEVQPVLCTQAVDYTGHPVNSHDHIWVEAIRQANEVIRDVAREEGVSVVDLAVRLDGSSKNFADERRMNREGNLQRAAIVAEFLSEQVLPR